MNSKMSPRKKHNRKDKNKQKHKSEHKPDRNYYESIIVALNRCLSELRTEFHKENDLNYALKDSVRTTVGDHFNAGEHLRRVLKRQAEHISRVEQELKILMLDQDKEDSEVKRRSKELDVEFTQLQDDLFFERQLVTYRLHSWEEYRVRMVRYAQKFESLLMRGMEREPKYKRLIIKLKKQRIEDWRNRYFDARDVIAQFKEDYISCADVRFAAYVTRLIQKNSAARKEFEHLTHLVFLMVVNLGSQRAKLEPLTVKCDLERELKSYLETVTKTQDHLIQEIVLKYEKLKAKYVDAMRHKKMYTTVLQGKPTIFPSVDLEETMRKMRKLEDTADLYEREVNRMWARQEEQEGEIRHLTKTVHRYEYAVQITVKSLRELPLNEPRVGWNNDKDTYDQRIAQCNDLITELISMLRSHGRTLLPIPSTQSLCSISSIYQPGDLGIFTRRRSISRRSTARFSGHASRRYLLETEYKEPFLHTKKYVDVVNSIIDVEMGSNLYVTSSTSLNFKKDQNMQKNSIEEVLNFSPTISSTSGLTIRPSSVIFKQEPTIVPIEKYNIK